MPKTLFISYSHKQGEWVWKNLVPCLRAGGAEVRIDVERMRAGGNVTAQMDAEQDACDLSLLVLSREYLASPYCTHEMQRAIASNKFVGVVRADCTVPDEIKKTLYVDLRDDKAAGEWDKLMAACEADLGTSVPIWLQVQREVVRYLERGISVNLLAGRKTKWLELINQIKKDYLPNLGIVDLQDGATSSRRGLVYEIVNANGTTKEIPPKPEDLVVLSKTVSRRSTPSQVALVQFDFITVHKDYNNDVELFLALRDLITEKRKLVLLIHSSAPCIELLPQNDLLTSLADLKLIELSKKCSS